MNRKKPMTRAELSEKIDYLTSHFGADAYEDGLKQGRILTCDAIQEWADEVTQQGFLALALHVLSKKLDKLRKGRKR